MKKLFFFLLLIGNISHAQDLQCQVFVNTEISSDEKISIHDEQAKIFGKIPNYRFKISLIKASTYQIEVYDESTPSRSYAYGILKNIGDEIKWSLWTREIILDASCTIVKE